MSRAPGGWLAPLVALAVMAAVVFQTLSALEVTGAFGRHARALPHPVVPAAYLALERALDQRDPRFTLDDLRDPFAYARPAADTVRVAQRPRVVPVAVPAGPVLTAIVWDSDPRALVRWKEKEWTVREGGSFDEFQVVSITRDQVTLRRGDATLVLQRRNLGD